MFMSGYSGEQIPMEMAIHNVRFFDINHLHDTQDQDTENDKREFHAKGKDVLRQKVLSSDSAYTTESYNQQLIRHNKLWSKIVSDFISNSETLMDHLHNLPQSDMVDKIFESLTDISSKFQNLDNDFTDYDKNMNNYNDYLDKLLKQRLKTRLDGNLDNQHNKDQKAIMDSIQAVTDVLTQYAGFMTSNHLVDQIKSY